MMKRSWTWALVGLALAAGQARSQQAQPKEGAAVVVDGSVRGVYRSQKSDRTDYVVQLDVTRAEMGRGAAEARRRGSTIPAPGEQVYVHVFQGANRGQGYASVPSEGATIKAYLYPHEGGGWEGTFPNWFDQSGGPPPIDRTAEARPTTPSPSPTPTPNLPPVPTSPSTAGADVLKSIGVKADAVEVNGRLVLRITDVLPNTPAQKAGFERGDVIIGVNKSGFASVQQLAEILAKGGPNAEFAILNVRTREQVEVPVDLTGVIAAAPTPTSPAPTSPAPSSPRRTLGVQVEPVRLGLRTALKVTGLQEGGPAKQAGIEVGDVLVEAGGIALNDQARLQEALNAAGEKIVVSVRDVRSGRDVPVEVALGAAPVPSPSPSPTPTPTPGPAPSNPAPTGGGLTAQSFGLTVKPGTADLLPVVKVAAVAPGSPAEKAGLEVGDAIVGVDDRVVFAPDLFEQALKSVGSSFTLTVLDVKSGKKTPVKIDLGR
ncbi:PDZ domain-containing protein [Paludisphaera rhizosphaerae]|uniref:PDZ domain-containing protein n=1 Tax=Paludisphaera rhizosphaerae TaxID=2711216 RepID=UPI0013EE1E27|nr:PDZ domain-containing protein [Paludisphaera rhizosphaerae]